jgi:HPt (histidine-containing phosphotransfer) domain-containing protein
MSNGNAGASTPAAAIHSEFADDPEFRELLEEFAAAMPVRREGLLEAHRTAAYALLRQRAHQLKGAGGGFGFPQLSELAAELEQACKADDPARIAEMLERVVGYISRIRV